MSIAESAVAAIGVDFLFRGVGDSDLIDAGFANSAHRVQYESVVPEPVTAALGLLSLAAVTGTIRRRR